jgi:hypothetical protein
MSDSPRASPPRLASRRGDAHAPPWTTEHQERSLIGRAAQALHAHGSTPQQLLGFLALAVTLTALVVLAGVTLAGAFAALVILSPLLLLTAPLWAPLAVAVFLAGAASLLACCAAGTWAHRYLAGWHPVGAHRLETTSSGGAAVAEVASRVRGYYDAYAREHGGYPPRPHARVKDAAPGA